VINGWLIFLEPGINDWLVIECNVEETGALTPKDIVMFMSLETLVVIFKDVLLINPDDKSELIVEDAVVKFPEVAVEFVAKDGFGGETVVEPPDNKVEVITGNIEELKTGDKVVPKPWDTKIIESSPGFTFT